MAQHILVVDDEPDVAVLFQGFIEMNGFRVSVAHDGPSALAIDEGDAADALVTDLSMPDMSGRELANHFRKRHPHLPIIVVSGYPGNDDLNDRNTVVLTKPVSLSLLVHRLKDLLTDRETLKNFDDGKS